MPSIKFQDDLVALQDAGGEQSVRTDLAACYRLVAMLGWDDLTATHISARIPGEEHAFLINPYGFLFEEVTASNLVKINAEGDLLEETEFSVNRAGFVIHSALHQARPDAGCVIHLHTRDGVAVSALRDGLLPLTQGAMVLADEIAFHDYEGPATNPEERERLARDLGSKNIMILRNHGTLVVGRSVAEAFRKAFLFESACSAQVSALSMNQPLHTASQAAIRATATCMSPSAWETNANIAWSALRRRLDRTDNSYKN